MSSRLVRIRLAFPVAALVLASIAAPGGSGALAATTSAAGPIGFGRSLLSAPAPVNPTSLQFGSDGRLYVSQYDGTIHAYDVVRNGANDYAVTSAETITAIREIGNHGDDGTPDPDVTGRLVTGLLVVGTAARPV